MSKVACQHIRGSAVPFRVKNMQVRTTKQSTQHTHCTPWF